MTCKTCEGYGFVSDLENQSPLGSGMVWLEEIWTECPDCLDLDKCPRCGQDGTINWEQDSFNEPIYCTNPNCDWKDDA